MANIPPGRFPSPNPKYPFVGKNYQANGELAGYIYNPFTDKYRVDPKAAQDAGVIPKPEEPPKPPGLGDTLLPIAAGAGALAGGKIIAEKGLGALPSLGGLLSGSGAAVPAAGIGPVASGAGYASALGGAAPAAAATEGAAATTGGLLSGVGSLGALPLAGVAAGTLLGGKAGLDMLQGKKPNLAGRVVLGMATGGLSEVANKFFGHKSTKQYQKERWGGLIDDGVVNAQVAQQANHPEDDSGVWQSGKYKGEKWSFDKALDLAKEDPTHFQHVYGNYKTFGNDWSNYNDAQQKAIVGRLVAEGLYNPSKGDVLIKDEDRARQIKDEVLGVAPQPEKAPPLMATPGQATDLTAVPRGNGLPGTIGGLLDPKVIEEDLKKSKPWGQ